MTCCLGLPLHRFGWCDWSCNTADGLHSGLRINGLEIGVRVICISMCIHSFTIGIRRETYLGANERKGDYESGFR